MNKNMAQVNQLELLLCTEKLTCAQLPVVCVGGGKDNVAWKKKPYSTLLQHYYKSLLCAKGSNATLE